MRYLEAWSGPLVVLLDGDGIPSGPEAYPLSTALLRWAKFIMVFGSAGKAADYKYALFAARVTKRVLLVETGRGDAYLWAAAKAKHAPTTGGRLLVAGKDCPGPNKASARGEPTQ